MSDVAMLVAAACLILAAASIVLAALSLRSAARAIWDPSGEGAPTPEPVRLVLPMSSGKNVQTGSTTKIARKNHGQAPFRPTRIVIGGSPCDWVINDIRIDGKSQLSQPGDLPGEAFAATAIDSFVSFDVVGVDREIEITVTYLGDLSSPFVCGILGVPSPDLGSRDHSNNQPKENNQ
jgi:hypothetical protein